MGRTTHDLVGRAPEQARISATVSGTDSGRLLLVGPAGIGKTALVEHAAEVAAVRGLRVLRACGVKAERYVPFAALHQLLLPLLTRLEDLPDVPRSSLARAFALTTAADAPDPLHVGLGALALLGRAEGRATVLLLDDVHWMDDASRAATRFVWRRAGAALRIVAATREDDPGWSCGPRETIALDPLGADDARELALRTTPGLGPQSLRRLLAWPRAIPWRWPSFPPTVQKMGDVGETPDLPVQTRLERAFAARLEPLDADARILLTTAAVHESPLLTDVLAAYAVLSPGPDGSGGPGGSDGSGGPGGSGGPRALRQAIGSGLVGVSVSRLVFLHPLVRSALVRAAGPERMAQVHRAVAATTRDEFAAVWHRAQASVIPDAAVAAALERVAAQARARGALRPARSALLRAASLSTDDRSRARRVVRAAEIAADLGEPDAVERLIAQARRCGLDEEATARLTLLENPGEDVVLTLKRLVDRAGTAIADDGEDLAADLLGRAARAAFRGALTDTDLREAVLSLAAGLNLPSGDPRLLTVRAALTPDDPEVGPDIARAVTTLVTGPGTDAALAPAAMIVGDWDSVFALTGFAAERLRRQERDGLLTETLALRAFAAAMLGLWDESLDAAVRAQELAGTTGQIRWQHSAELSRALVAAYRGQDDLARRLVEPAERYASRTGDVVLLDSARLALGLAHLGADRHPEAYEILSARLGPETPAFHPGRCLWAVDLLAEAAVGAGRVPEARELLHSDLTGLVSSPPAQIRARQLARALLTDDPETTFRAAALGARGAPGWHRARVGLYHGMWLRRHLRPAEARAALEPGVLVLERLGARAWTERARQEAAIGRRSTDSSRSLTVQELRIARLATEGLTNKEIRLRLFLTHRTVGTHLYRVFSKLDVRTRGQLHRALDEAGLLDR